MSSPKFSYCFLIVVPSNSAHYIQDEQRARAVKTKIRLMVNQLEMMAFSPPEPGPNTYAMAPNDPFLPNMTIMYLAEDDLSNVLDLIVLMQLVDASRNHLTWCPNTPTSTYPQKNKERRNKVRCMVPVQLMKHKNREACVICCEPWGMMGVQKGGGSGRIRKKQG
jgi:hypothetical protein